MTLAAEAPAPVRGPQPGGPVDMTACTRLELPPRSLVVLAGLPGAGKTTLLRRVAGTPGVLALDSEDVALRLAPLPLPYRWLRPLVHALHLVRVALAVHSDATCVLTTDPFTSPARRRLLARSARLAKRDLHVLLVAATAEQARAGRRRRGRPLPAARVARHEHAYDVLHRRVHHQLSREAAAHVTCATVARDPAGTPPPHDAADSSVASPHEEMRPMLSTAVHRRPALGIAAIATTLGLWFGMTAPDVSPVLVGPDGVVLEDALLVAVVDQDGDRGRGGRDGDEGGGPR